MLDENHNSKLLELLVQVYQKTIIANLQPQTPKMTSVWMNIVITLFDCYGHVIHLN